MKSNLSPFEEALSVLPSIFPIESEEELILLAVIQVSNFKCASAILREKLSLQFHKQRKIDNKSKKSKLKCMYRKRKEWARKRFPFGLP